MACIKSIRRKKANMSYSGLVASVIRFIGFFTIDAVSDPTWSAVPLIIWTVVETGMYLITCCLPTYRPLMKKAGMRITNNLYRQSDFSKHKGGSNGKAPSKGPILGMGNRTDNSCTIRSGEPEEDRVGLVEEYGIPMNRIRVEQQFQVKQDARCPHRRGCIDLIVANRKEEMMIKIILLLLYQPYYQHFEALI